MKFLLDTNVVIRHLNGRAPSVAARLGSVRVSEVFVSSLLIQELEYGIARKGLGADRIAQQEAFIARFTAIPFDAECARTAGRLRAALERIGTPISPYDLQVAAIALAHGLTLVTHNTREFARVPNLLLEGWEAQSGEWE